MLFQLPVSADENFAAGMEPSELAVAYSKLFVIMIKSHDSKPDLCERLAVLGKGKLVVADSFEDVPSILRNLLRDFVYRLTAVES